MHLAIIGYGSIAQTVTDCLATRPVDRLTVLVRSDALVRTLQHAALAGAATHVEVTDDIATLIEGAPDLVVEAAGHAAVAAYGPDLLAAGLDLVLVSVGALADEAASTPVHAAAQEGGGELILPSGAIGGIDLLSALALSGEVKVTYRGTKPPAAWRGTSAEHACDLAALTGPHVFFLGSAREAAIQYPKNANVAATLALAGAGFDATHVELVADPAASGNAHAYEVESAAGHFAMQIENAPSSGNAKTSLATVYSVIREIIRRRDRLMT